MDEKTDTRRRPEAGRAAHNGAQHQHEHEPPGMDLPFFGHVPYKSIGFLTGLGVVGAAGAIEWPVVAAVGIGYVLARR